MLRQSGVKSDEMYSNEFATIIFTSLPDSKRNNCRALSDNQILSPIASRSLNENNVMYICIKNAKYTSPP